MKTGTMKPLLIMTALLVVLSLGAFMDDIETAKEGVVTIVGGENQDDVTASGFVVGSADGACYVVTSGKINADDLERIYLWRPGEEPLNAVQVYDLSDFGVSVIKVLGEPEGLTPLVINTDFGDTLDTYAGSMSVLGYSGGLYLSDSEHMGSSIGVREESIESARVETIDGVRYFRYANSLDVRTEGGPLLDESGRVIGVNVFAGSDGESNAAVDIMHIMPYLEEAGIPLTTGMAYSTRSIIWLAGGALAVIIVLIAVVCIIKRKKYVIFGLTGVQSGVEIPLGREHIAFGRDPSQCSVVYPLEQKGISRRHCEVYFDRKLKKYMLLDQSSEGTFIYGQRMAKGRPLELKDGAKFYLAETSQMFEFRRK